MSENEVGSVICRNGMEVDNGALAVSVLTHQVGDESVKYVF